MNDLSQQEVYTAQADIADRMAAYKASSEFVEHRARAIGEALIIAINRADSHDHGTTMAVLAAMLEELGADTPEPLLYGNQVRADAAWWADLASPGEVEAYTAAGLRQIADKGRFCIAARKRLLIMIWNSLTAADRKSFLAHAVKTGGDA